MGFGFGFAFAAGLGGAVPRELVANGNFDADLSGWTDASSAPGSAVWDAGVARLTTVTGSRGRLRQAVQTEIGRSYRLLVTRNGSLSLDIGTSAGGSQVAAAVPLVNGANIVNFVALSAQTWINFYVTNDVSSTIDSVSAMIT